MAHVIEVHGGESEKNAASGHGDTVSRTYLALFSESKSDALISIHTFRPATVTSNAGVLLVYDDIDIKHIETETWEATVTWIDPDKQDQKDTTAEAPEWSFDVGDATTHITHGYSVRHAFPAGANKDIFKGAIGYKKDAKGKIEVKGITTDVPSLNFTLTTKIPRPANPHELARRLTRASKKTNSTIWYGFEAGEVKFNTARITGKGREKWTMAFSFEASENITIADNFVIPNLGAIEKRGHDYFEVYYEPAIDPATETLIAVPKYGFTHVICREFDFATLGLGG